MIYEKVPVRLRLWFVHCPEPGFAGKMQTLQHCRTPKPPALDKYSFFFLSVSNVGLLLFCRFEKEAQYPEIWHMFRIGGLAFNPFTAPACKISRLEAARACQQT